MIQLYLENELLKFPDNWVKYISVIAEYVLRSLVISDKKEKVNYTLF